MRASEHRYCCLREEKKEMKDVVDFAQQTTGGSVLVKVCFCNGFKMNCLLQGLCGRLLRILEVDLAVC